MDTRWASETLQFCGELELEIMKNRFSVCLNLTKVSGPLPSTLRRVEPGTTGCEINCRCVDVSSLQAVLAFMRLENHGRVVRETLRPLFETNDSDGRGCANHFRFTLNSVTSCVRSSMIGISRDAVSISRFSLSHRLSFFLVALP